MIPVLSPSSVQEILDLGLHAFAMSRSAGVWAGMKTIQEVVESASSVQIDAQRVRISCLVYDPSGACVARYAKVHHLRFANGRAGYEDGDTIEQCTAPG